MPRARSSSASPASVELDLVGGAPEQLDADELLERADLPAQRRLRQVQLLGGAPEVELLGHGDERAQVPELDGVRRAREGQYPFLVHARDYPRASRERSCESCMTAISDRPFPFGART